MATLVTKLVVGWFVEQNGADVEAWIRRRLRIEKDPWMRATLRWGLRLVQKARGDPFAFADEVESHYDRAIPLYREYQRRQGSEPGYA